MIEYEEPCTALILIDKKCVKCGSKVYHETDLELHKEYPYYCKECDENLYSIEVVSK